MPSLIYHMPAKNILSVLILCLTILAEAAFAQEQKPPAGQTDDVLRVSTSLVQTDAMVFDQQGRFVSGLKPQQFELFVDGKPQKISFFEQVRAGSVDEDAQLAAARGRPLAGEGGRAPRPLDRGRLIYFFVDDFHLSPSNMHGVRALISRFVEQEMGQNDEVAIASASGQVGFLQQLTGERAVLRAAIERLKPRSTSSGDGDSTPMSEYQALLISKYDQAVTDFFVDRTMSENYGLRRPTALEMVRARAQTILRQTSVINRNMLARLENLVGEAATLQGRKLVFFISDGFFLDKEATDALGLVVRSAARASAVIYSLDSRGLVATANDSNSAVTVDLSNRLERANAQEVLAALDPLNALAADTGGRAIFGTNAPEASMAKALEETSVYYLLAWRPEGVEQRSGKARRIELKVTGHPELTVRLRRGIMEAEAPSRPKANDAQTAPAKSLDDDLRVALRSLYPVTSLPTELDLVYMDAPDNGDNLIVSMRVARQFLTFTGAGDKAEATLDLAGAIFNDQGQTAAGFKERLEINAASSSGHAESQRQEVIYHFQARLKPGIYQVRTVGRDAGSGRAGSAMKWIEIPDLASRRLSVSSLLLSEVVRDVRAGGSASKPTLSVDHRFASSSALRFLIFIYNAARGAEAGGGLPDLALQLQVMRDDQPVVTLPLHKVETKDVADAARIPYAAEVSLEGLPAGRYVLLVTVVDRLAKASASRRTSFQIE